MKSISYILSQLLMVNLLISCSNQEGKVIDEAYRLSSSAPDSALSLLNTLDHHKLNERKEARYALVYTIAQDKSGLDVNDDSLIHIAYTYYKERPNDSLYAKCMYYTGNCYFLCGQSEVALNCFQKAVDEAKNVDKYTMCLALNRISKIYGKTDLDKAVSYAQKADRVYSTIANASTINKIYFKLDYCMALALNNDLFTAKQECLKAMKMAVETRDSSVIADVCLDMSNILRGNKEFSEALTYSKKAYRLSRNPSNEVYINLSWAYLNMDSLDICERILPKIQTNIMSDLYTRNYLQHLLSIKKHDYRKAIIYADSAYSIIERMYGDEMKNKVQYFAKWSASQYEENLLRSRTRFQLAFSIVLILSTLIVIFLLLYIYKQQEVKTETELKMQKTQQKSQQEQQYRVELLFAVYSKESFRDLDGQRTFRRLS